MNEHLYTDVCGNCGTIFTLVCLHVPYMFPGLLLNSPVTLVIVPTGSPSHGGDVAVYVFDIKQLSLPTLFFYSILVSVSVFKALSIVFHSINSPDKSPLFHSVLQVLSLPFWSFELYVDLYISL